MECGDIERARRAAGRMTNWRRGTATAALAEHFARSGDPQEARRLLEAATRLAEGEEDWRRDRIRVAIARVQLVLGEAEEAARMEQGLELSEFGKADSLRATSEPEDRFDARLEVIDRVLEARSFDQTRNQTATIEALYRRYHGSEARRALILERIRTAVVQLAMAERIAFLLRLSAIATELGDRTSAMAFLDEAQAFATDQRWLAEDQVPILARIATARFLAGDPEAALALAESAAQTYRAGRQTIVDVFRAEALRPLAETYAAMGRNEEALEFYRMAVEEGALNPNARPRALDLCDTACSMAAGRVEPDAALCRRMREIQGALGAPW
jgi:tetratricopeptide (TPR) repeat protein